MGESQDFLWDFFLSHSAVISLGANPLVSFISGIKKVWIKEEGGVSMFPVETFCLTVPKNFIGERLCAVFQKITSSEKV